MSKPGRELLESAWQWRWRVPELALLLGNRATSLARETGDVEQRLRAEFIALFAANRLGRSVAGVERALGAVRDAEQAGLTELLDQLRVELACCARSSGSHDVASRVLHPLLEREGTPPQLRAHALLELCGALPMYRRSSERVEALDEADRLYAAEATHDQDTVRLLRARVDAVRAGHHRGHGEFTTAIDSAARGIDFLERLGDPAADSGGIRASLVLEQAQALLDLGRHGEAVRCSADLLQQPLRAAAAAPVGWLRLALTTRVYLPAGQRQAALESLNEALGGARRHELLDLQAAVLNVLSNVHESAAELREALHCVREAYSADYRRRTMIEHARVRLLEWFPGSESGDHSIPKQQSVGGVSRASSERTVPTRRVSEPSPPTSGQGNDTRQAARQLMDTLVKHGGVSNNEELAEAVGEGFGRSPVSRTSSSGGSRSTRAVLKEQSGESSTGPAERAREEFGTPAREQAGGGRRRRRDRSERDSGWPSGTGGGFPDAGQEAGDVPGTRGREGNTSVGFPMEDPPAQGVPVEETTAPRDESAAFSQGSAEAGRYSASTSSADDVGAARTAREDGAVPGGLQPADDGWPSAGEMTTVLPVVPPAPAADTAPERSDSVPDRQDWPYDDPVPGSTSPSSEYGDGSRGPVPEEERWQGQTDHVPDGAEGQRRQGSATSSHDRDDSAGRRSSGRSFAEIKAALDAEQRGAARDRASHGAPVPESGRSTGGRRRRADPPAEGADAASDAAHGGSTESDSGEKQPVHPAVTEELLEQSRDLIKDLPELENADSGGDDTDQAGLADLLAEALVAYQHGRQGTAEDDGNDSAGPLPEQERSAPAGTHRGERPVEGGSPGRAAEEPDDTEEPRSRRRHAAGEDGDGNAYTWTPQVR
ncbi:tetratricopeptide (TPR) repeat protein [Actinopolyspora biskrensis]|uniref:Tetratricopeptide (TPR) repeat protein n=1 Tax=Actinopolyspora biskrensis TaxID=1470178 RepID=A0A852YYK8_9ACTN|nr:hypothetical protein [Actinopolyspora biskrensis]NYH79681.1 tetratricopeptide (TPR) repeat protein [Actinopolyspora biskrensis]